MNDSAESKSRHIDVEELASLTEPGAGVVERSIVAHLSDCPRCLAIYAEFVRTRARFLRPLEAEMPPADVVERVLDLPSPHVPSRAAAAGRGRRAWVPVAAAAAVVAALGLVRFAPRERPAVPPQLPPQLSQLMRMASFGKLMYADSLLPQPSGTRGRLEAASELDLAPLVSAHRVGPPDPEVSYWLIAGLLSTGRWRDADPYVRQSLTRFPDDARFHNLAAIWAYEQSDLSLAESELRAALARERGPALLLNLAQVMTETGRHAEAAALLAEVVERHPSSPAAGLARERGAGAVGSALR